MDGQKDRLGLGMLARFSARVARPRAVAVTAHPVGMETRQLVVVGWLSWRVASSVRTRGIWGVR
jgi:hypothetical protein